MCHWEQPMAVESPRPLRRVLRHARQALGMSQEELAQALGSSRRTIIRRERGQSYPVEEEGRQMESLVRPDEPDLADELRAAAGMEVVQEPDVTAPAAPHEIIVAAVAPPILAKHSVDAILYAAAD